MTDKFIRVYDENGRSFYGGDQNWLNDLGKDIVESGCGVVAAVNVSLYLAKRYEISKQEYIALVQKFAKKHPFSRIEMKLGIGADPFMLGRYLRKTNNLSKSVKLHYRWGSGRQTQYELMKKMLGADIPVIWGLYSFFSGKNKGLMLYSFKNGAYIERGTTRAHYVTATGIVEKMGENEPHRRMVRVSSWGEELYVDFDEYESFRLGKGEKFFKRVFCICNRIGSNILKIEIK